jgi:hypothetical protein
MVLPLADLAQRLRHGVSQMLSTPNVIC